MTIKFKRCFLIIEQITPLKIAALELIIFWKRSVKQQNKRLNSRQFESMLAKTMLFLFVPPNPYDARHNQPDKNIEIQAKLLEINSTPITILVENHGKANIPAPIKWNFVIKYEWCQMNQAKT